MKENTGWYTDPSGTNWPIVDELEETAQHRAKDTPFVCHARKIFQ
jgi:hypothetical protein